MESTIGQAQSLLGLPSEIVLDIYQQLDVGSIYQLCLASRYFYELFISNKATVLLPVMAREFSPFHELLQVYTASADDLICTQGAAYQPRKVIFKRFQGDVGIQLAPPPAPAMSNIDHIARGFTQVGKADAGLLNQKTHVLRESDLGPIIKHCQLVRKWEELFPQMRWFYDPERCRLLRLHEKERFRKALYRWWLYGIYFHGDLPRPRVGLPEPHVDDIRISQMRYHSTSDLLELMDLVETMKDVVLHYICPRLDPNDQHHSSDQPALIDSVDRAQSLTDSWMDQSHWSRIVKTYAKLGPKDLMYYFENIYSYPRKRLISEIRFRHPNFTFDQESIQIAVRCALDERQWLDKVPSLAEDSAGGIIDFDDERDDERQLFGKDGSPDGLLPPGSKVVRSLSQYSPRGDDGSWLEDQHAQTWAGSRVAPPSQMVL
ncbi:unnamed protein product [Clonostachys solani]|uniref:F-box domain-containing protein n=1 Tax=Clonostachys solani TaxID=160281 RepID=A0A9N9ZH72_9HYPO|nr:unnamed protein product [Clonostachys solani]